MANFKGKGGLGKGLFALIPQEAENGQENYEPKEVAITKITANPFQPRREFDKEALAELTDSIKRHGVVQPVLLRQMPDGDFQLVAGERRLRASKAAGLKMIPAVVKSLDDSEMMEIALIENIQRQDLNPVEEARAYKRLAEEFQLTQEQIAKKVSKSRSFIANSTRLLNLSERILDHLGQGDLTVGHVRPLLTLPQEESEQLAELMVQRKATVREAENWAKMVADPNFSEENLGSDSFFNAGVTSLELLPPFEKSGDQVLVQPTQTGSTASIGKNGEEKSEPKLELPVELKEIQRVLRDRIKTKVEITQNSRGGKIIVEYYTQDDLDRILALFTGSREVD